ncbi:hypothetical protein F4679DRAFT_581126 [Xylaria curta]|nr:hypothetical protein F4679DRAFT_581126 [Xylaria curta]
MAPSTDPAHWSKFAHIAITGKNLAITEKHLATMDKAEVAQSSNEGSSDTMAFPILQLPPEVLLGVFRQLATQQSYPVNLIRAHPIFYTLFKENQCSITKAITNGFLARLAKWTLRYKSPYLMKIFLMKRQIQHSDIIKSYEDLSAVLLSSRWIPSLEDLSLTYHRFGELSTFCILVGELEFLGYFAQESNPDLWCERRFLPVARWMHNRLDWEFGAFTYKTQPRFENIELLAIIELWCIMRIKYGSAAMSISTFRNMFAPEIAEKTKQFARRHIEVCKHPMTCLLNDRYGEKAFIFCMEAIGALAELAGFSEDESRIHEEMVERSFLDASYRIFYEPVAPSYYLTKRIEDEENVDLSRLLCLDEILQSMGM